MERRGVAPACALACLSFAGLSACGSARRADQQPTIPRNLLRDARPIGTGPRFQPPVTGKVVGDCRPGLGSRFAVHVEVFAANRVVILPAGIGTKPPRDFSAGRVTRARCYGGVVTVDATGVVLVRPEAHFALSALFRAWGEQLSATRLCSFSAHPGSRVVAYLDGRRWPGDPRGVPLLRHAEIVVEVGPPVPPHSSFAFPKGI